MTAFFASLGAGLAALIGVLITMLRHERKKNIQHEIKTKTLESKVDYRDEVISILTNPKSTDDTIDSLRDGKF